MLRLKLMMAFYESTCPNLGCQAEWVQYLNMQKAYMTCILFWALALDVDTYADRSVRYCGSGDIAGTAHTHFVTRDIFFTCIKPIASLHFQFAHEDLFFMTTSQATKPEFMQNSSYCNKLPRCVIGCCAFQVKMTSTYDRVTNLPCWI